MVNVPRTRKDRLGFVLDLGWDVLFSQVVSGRVAINKEASLQLHYATVLHGLGEQMCLEREELFRIELESAHGTRNNIDITCSFDDGKAPVRAAVELKCFRSVSNRPADVDMYDVYRDLSRLWSFNEYQLKRFICLTDRDYYVFGKHTGRAEAVSIRNGVSHKKGDVIEPSWIGAWKDKSRDKPIAIQQDLALKWMSADDTTSSWYYLKLEL